MAIKSSNKLRNKILILFCLVFSLNSIESKSLEKLPVLIKDYRGNGCVKTKKILKTLLIDNPKKTNKFKNMFKRNAYGVATLLAGVSMIDKLKISFFNDITWDKYAKKIELIQYGLPTLAGFIVERILNSRQINKNNYLALKDIIANWDICYKSKIDSKLHYYFEELKEVYANNPEVIKQNSNKIIEEIKSIL